jgi:hypothetical protein
LQGILTALRNCRKTKRAGFLGAKNASTLRSRSNHMKIPMSLKYPVKEASFSSLDDTSIPLEQWWLYPVGAHISFYQGYLQLYVSRVGSEYVLEVCSKGASAGSFLQRFPTKEKAMLYAEKWLEENKPK